MKLSIITVSYNSEATIETTIRSVVSQKTSEIEYIIIDGKSTDGTLEIVNKYRNMIDIIVSEKDKGISDAFNKGIEMASGEYIGIINSDDQFLRGAFEKFFKEVKADTDVFFGNGIRLYADGKCKKYMSDPDEQKLHNEMSLVHPSTIVRRTAYIKYGKFDVSLKYVMDRECLLRMLDGGAKFQYSDDFYTVYSMGGKSDTNYLTGVAPENYKIDIKNGKSKFSAGFHFIKRYIFFYMLQIRSALKLDHSNRVDYTVMLEQIGIGKETAI